ncbi:hypothetical protein GCM10010195_00330 [Kitasatospora griseola]|nr:hypothetical protein GCM10010195_00330 [Kitasatospora griseola]
MEFLADQGDGALPAALPQVQGGLCARHARPDHDDPVRCPQLSHGVHPNRPAAATGTGVKVEGLNYHGSPAHRAERRAVAARDRPNLIRVMPAKGEEVLWHLPTCW